MTIEVSEKNNTKNIVIIGGVAAGMSAASKIRRLDPDASISVFEKSGHVSYGSCGLPYLISGLVESPEDLVAYNKEYFKEKRGIDVFLHHEVLKIYPEKTSVLVRNLETGQEEEHQYDKLLISTGARAMKPPLEGIDLNGIFMIRNLEDGIAVKAFIEKNSPKKGVIVGAGYIGMEIAESLRQLSIDVTIVEKMPTILGTMDEEINEVVEKELVENEVAIVKSTTVTKFKGENSQLKSVVLGDGRALDVDIAIIAVGVRPNSEIAKDAGVILGTSGAIKINNRMETNLPNIYSAGDCAEVYHKILGKNVYFPLGTTANKQGKAAGSNIAGKSTTFNGIVGTSVFKSFGLEVARTGLSEKDSYAEGIETNVISMDKNSRANYYPGNAKIRIKLIADKNTGRLLGAEMAGRDGVSKRIDVLAAALMAEMTIPEVEGLDLSYAPPFAPVWDPILTAARELRKKMDIYRRP